MYLPKCAAGCIIQGMKIARVIRPIWSTKKCDLLHGIRLLEVEVEQYGYSDQPKTTTLIADNLGAGLNERIFVCFGSAVRNVVFSPVAPFKAVNTAIIDDLYLDEALLENASNFKIPLAD
jgi:microcompartment protein CcmK/EutM